MKYVCKNVVTTMRLGADFFDFDFDFDFIFVDGFSSDEIKLSLSSSSSSSSSESDNRTNDEPLSRADELGGGK